MVIGKHFGDEMEALYRRDLEEAREITREEWRRRPWLDRVKETGASLFRYWI